jgi:hypothetical protein
MASFILAMCSSNPLGNTQFFFFFGYRQSKIIWIQVMFGFGFRHSVPSQRHIYCYVSTNYRKVRLEVLFLIIFFFLLFCFLISFLLFSFPFRLLYYLFLVNLFPFLLFILFLFIYFVANKGMFYSLRALNFLLYFVFMFFFQFSLLFLN